MFGAALFLGLPGSASAQDSREQNLRKIYINCTVWFPDNANEADARVVGTRYAGRLKYAFVVTKNGSFYEEQTVNGVRRLRVCGPENTVDSMMSNDDYITLAFSVCYRDPDGKCHVTVTPAPGEPQGTPPQATSTPPPMPTGISTPTRTPTPTRTTTPTPAPTSTPAPTGTSTPAPTGSTHSGPVAHTRCYGDSHSDAGDGATARGGGNVRFADSRPDVGSHSNPGANTRADSGANGNSCAHTGPHADAGANAHLDRNAFSDAGADHFHGVR